MPHAYCVILITAPSVKTADKLANILLQKRLASCVTLIPQINSKYWWKGRIENARETLLIVKTRFKLTSRLVDCIAESHPHSIPESISLPITRGHKPYFDWIKSATKTATLD